MFDPAAPAQRGSIDTPAGAERVVLSGSLDLITDTSTGLLVVDVTDPASPAILGSIDRAGASGDSPLLGDLVLVTY